MLLTLELATRGFVSAFEEEEYELTKILNRESDSELDDDDNDESEDNEGNYSAGHPESEREIFDDDDSDFIREYY